MAFHFKLPCNTIDSIAFWIVKIQSIQVVCITSGYWIKEFGRSALPSIRPKHRVIPKLRPVICLRLTSTNDGALAFKFLVVPRRFGNHHDNLLNVATEIATFDTSKWIDTSSPSYVDTHDEFNWINEQLLRQRDAEQQLIILFAMVWCSSIVYTIAKRSDIMWSVCMRSFFALCGDGVEFAVVVVVVHCTKSNLGLNPFIRVRMQIQNQEFFFVCIDSTTLPSSHKTYTHIHARMPNSLVSILKKVIAAFFRFGFA